MAIVAGQEIDEEDLRPLVRARLISLQRQEYEIKRAALEELIERKILEIEARKRSLTVEQLLEQEADSKVSDPSPSEVEAYYQGQKDHVNRPFSQIESQLKLSLKQARIDLARQNFIARLRNQAEVSILLRPPKTEISYDRARLRGDPGAAVIIVEFSDFQCPHCRAVQPVLNQVLAKYRGKVSLAFRDFPVLQLHPQARVAAEAARCAGEQGRFWEYHDALFSTQKLDRQSLVNFARNLGLNQGNFEECIRSGRFGPQVEQDFRDGQNAGVAGTPTFFINGLYVEGEQSVSDFERIINQELVAGNNGPGE